MMRRTASTGNGSHRLGLALPALPVVCGMTRKVRPSCSEVAFRPPTAGSHPGKRQSIRPACLRSNTDPKANVRSASRADSLKDGFVPTVLVIAGSMNLSLSLVGPAGFEPTAKGL